MHLNLNPLFRRNVLTGCNEQRCTGRDFCLLHWKKYFLGFGVCFLGPRCRAQLISGSVLRIILGGAQVTICGLWDRTWVSCMQGKFFTCCYLSNPSKCLFNTSDAGDSAVLRILNPRHLIPGLKFYHLNYFVAI